MPQPTNLRYPEVEMLVKTKLKDSKVYQAYIDKTPKSGAYARRSKDMFPDGVTHYARHLKPYPLFVSHAKGSRKWDVDGNEYVDYFGGHGALILGHGHPAVLEAIHEQLDRGTHFGAEHELELEWAALIREIVPSAETMRFTSSGTEATHLALRLARAYTGKPNFVRFASHFHGWHDHVAFSTPPPPGDVPSGIPRDVVGHALIVEPNDVAAVDEILSRRDDVAAVILEPTGAAFGRVPTRGETLSKLREVSSRHGVVLIFDEVITGFRCAPGGAQEVYGVTPDMTTLAKIVAGGMPGAVVTGRADIFHSMDFGGGDEGISDPQIAHHGTFNASPVSAAAGLAQLRLLRDGKAIAQANETTKTLRDEMNAVLRKMGSNWCVYGEFSGFHIFTNPNNEPVGPAEILDGKVHWKTLKGTPPELTHKLRLAFIGESVDICGWPGGHLSSAHSREDLDVTIRGFENVMRQLADEGDLD